MLDTVFQSIIRKNGNAANEIVNTTSRWVGDGNRRMARRIKFIDIDKLQISLSSTKISIGFGRSVSIDGNTIIMGAPSAENNIGASYIFRHAGSDWVEEAKLVSSDAIEWGNFGNSLSISGNYAIVGNVGLDEANVEGAAYIVMYDGSSWSEQEKIGAFDEGVGAGQSFGNTVAINGDTVVVGEPNIWNDAGAVYLFKRTGADYIAQGQLIPSDGADTDFFGCSVSISADPEIIHIGGEGSSTTLSWTSRDADSVRIDPGIGSVSESGSLTVSPQ